VITLPYSTIDLTSDEIENILCIFNTLQGKFSVSFKMDFAFSFEKFSLFENYLDHSIGPVIEIHHNENLFYLTFTQVFYRMNTASRFPVSATKEYQTWCVLPLNRQYGHVMIKTETVFDKINELIHTIEIDFSEDTEFSKKFYVLANDELLARSLLNARFRNCLKQLREKDLWIEILLDKLIIGNKKRIETSTTLEMADVLYKLSELIN
jgi:hypothetical protein